MSLCPNLIVHLRRHHSFVRERERAVEDSLERGEWSSYTDSQGGKDVPRNHQLSASKPRSERKPVHTASSEKRRRRETMAKSARYRKREKQRKVRRRAKRATLTSKRRSTWLPSRNDSDNETGSDVSADDYDDIATKRLEKRWAREEALKATMSRPSKGTTGHATGPARKAVRRLSTWYHGESDDEQETEPRERRHRDTLGRRVSTWFVELPRRDNKPRVKGKKTDRHGSSRRKGSRDETDEENEGSDVDIDHILKMALGDSNHSMQPDDGLMDDDEFLDWTDDDLVDDGPKKGGDKY